MEAAYQHLLHEEEKNNSSSTGQGELQAQVTAWLQTPDWETSQTYLQDHPMLLTDAAEQMMEALKQSQREQQAQEMLNLHQALLKTARVEGVEVAYKRLIVSGPETLLSDQEVESYQVLQDLAALNDAGITTLSQYRVSGQTSDMKRALECWLIALNLTSPDSPEWPGYLSNMGLGLYDLYSHTGDLVVLDEAITLCQQAVQVTPSNSPERHRYLNNLGNSLRDRYAGTRDLADLEEAIAAYQQAVQATPSNSPERSARMSNLGNSLRDRYIRTRDLGDLGAAITAFQQAIRATPLNSPNLPGYLNNLGNGQSDRYSRTGKLTDLEAAITAWEEAWSKPYPHFAALPVAYQLGFSSHEFEVAAHLIGAYLKQAKQAHLRSTSVPCRTLEIAEGSKSRLLTQLVGRGPLPLPLGLSEESVMNRCSPAGHEKREGVAPTS